MNKEKVVLINDLSPGDVLIMTAAVRSLHKAYPDKYITDVRSPCNEIFQNSPYITPLAAKDKAEEQRAIETLKKDENHPPIIVKDINGDDMKYIISHYPEIHRSSMTGLPFVDGHRMFLEKQLNIPIARSGMKPDIFFSNDEIIRDWDAKPKTPYWIINAGIKNDYTLKYYSHYQEVVDLLKDKIQFVQVGHAAHNHPALNNVIDMRGKTSLRELFVLSYYADGALCCVTMQMVIMAALSKPCVVIAGAREGVRWQLNPDHQFIYRNGVMKCAPYDGCWHSKLENCAFKADNGHPMCLELIEPQEVARAIRLYYLGGRLEHKGGVVKKEEIKNESSDRRKNTYYSEDDAILSLDPLTFFRHKSGHACATSTIFNVMRILKKINPDDKYLEAYYWHYNKRQDIFTDLYHFLWWLGSNHPPKRILEIGVRTGLSICQLLSSMMFYDEIERIVLCDNFSEIGSPDSVLKSIEYLNIPTDKIEFIVGNSLDEVPKLEEKFDYILVDGCHDKPFASADLENAVNLIAKDGYIAMDDLTPDGCSLQDVWDQFKVTHKEMFDFAETHCGKGLGVARRVK